MATYTDTSKLTINNSTSSLTSNTVGMGNGTISLTISGDTSDLIDEASSGNSGNYTITLTEDTSGSILNGAAPVNTMLLNAGSDTINITGYSSNNITLGAGNETIHIYATTNAAVNGSDFANLTSNTILLGSGTDVLTIAGNSSNTIQDLVGSTGSFTANLTGQIAGDSDHFNFGNSTNSVSVTGGSNNDIAMGASTAATSNSVTISGGSNLASNYIFLQAATNTVTISGNESDIINMASTGKETLNISGGTTSDVNTIYFGSGTATVNASSSAGHDTVMAGSGADSITLGSGGNTVLYNASISGSYTSTANGGSGTNVLDLAFASTAQLTAFEHALGSIYTSFGSHDHGTSFNFATYNSAMGFSMDLTVTNFNSIVVDVNPTNVAETSNNYIASSQATINGATNLLAGDAGYSGHALSMEAISNLTVTGTSSLAVAVDVRDFNPALNEIAVYDLTPSGSTSPAILTFFNNGTYTITNAAASGLDALVASNNIHLNFNYTDVDGFGGQGTNTGTINLAPAIAAASITSSSLAFGTVTLGNSVTLTETIMDSGTAPLVLASLAVPAGYTDTFVAETLNPGQSETFNVTFKPTATGLDAGNMVFTDNAGNIVGSTQSVALSGTGYAPVATTTTENISLDSTSQQFNISSLVANPNGDTLTFTTPTGAAFTTTQGFTGTISAVGVVTINTTGANLAEYDTAGGGHISDSFTYKVTDAFGNVSTATINLSELVVTELPVAVADSASTSSTSPLVINVWPMTPCQTTCLLVFYQPYT